MLLEELLDLRHVGAAVDAVDHALVDHEDERRHFLDRELLEQPRMLVRIHSPHAQPVALLPGDVGEEAFHAAGRT